VRGTEGLRVVDASVFPKIPGHFIVSAVYMISEKALDVILEDAERMVMPCAQPAPAMTERSAAEPEQVNAV
jgi:choline dehydrogenase-like flavoprotein